MVKAGFSVGDEDNDRSEAARSVPSFIYEIASVTQTLESLRPWRTSVELKSTGERYYRPARTP